MINLIRGCVIGIIIDIGIVELLTEIFMYMYLICLLYEEYEVIFIGFIGGIIYIFYFYLKSMFWYNIKGFWEIFYGKFIILNKYNISGFCFNICNIYRFIGSK